MASSLKRLPLPRCAVVTVLLVAGLLGDVAAAAPEVRVTCRTPLDLSTGQYKSGVLVSALPVSIPDYGDDVEKCDIKLSIATGSVLMIYFDRLDFYAANSSTCNSTNIQLFDGSVGVYVMGLDRQICGRDEQKPSGVYFIEKYNLTIRVTASGAYLGTGFRIHFTVATRAYPCASNEFACENFGARRCIASSLVCDGWNDCGDRADERQNCTKSSGMTGGTDSDIVHRPVSLYLTLLLCALARAYE